MHYCFLTLKFRKRDPGELEVTADNKPRFHHQLLRGR